MDLSLFENLQSSNVFSEFVGARVTAIASGTVSKVASSLENAQSYTYVDPTSITKGNSLYVNLNDVDSSRNEILKYGLFFNDSNVTPPMFIVSVSNTDSANRIDNVVCFGEIVDEDKRILKVTSYRDLTGAADANMVFDVFAIQLSLSSSDIASGFDPSDYGANDTINPDDGGGVPGEDNTDTETDPDVVPA